MSSVGKIREKTFTPAQAHGSFSYNRSLAQYRIGLQMSTGFPYFFSILLSEEGSINGRIISKNVGG